MRIEKLGPTEPRSSGFAETDDAPAGTRMNAAAAARATRPLRRITSLYAGRAESDWSASGAALRPPRSFSSLSGVRLSGAPEHEPRGEQGTADQRGDPQRDARKGQRLARRSLCNGGRAAGDGAEDAACRLLVLLRRRTLGPYCGGNAARGGLGAGGRRLGSLDR